MYGNSSTKSSLNNAIKDDARHSAISQITTRQSACLLFHHIVCVQKGVPSFCSKCVGGLVLRFFQQSLHQTDSICMYVKGIWAPGHYTLRVISMHESREGQHRLANSCRIPSDSNRCHLYQWNQRTSDGDDIELLAKNSNKTEAGLPLNRCCASFAASEASALNSWKPILGAKVRTAAFPQLP